MPGPAGTALLDVMERMVNRHDSALTIHPDFAELAPLLASVEASTHERLWNTQRDMQVSLHRRTWNLDRRSRDRDIEERTVYGRRAAMRYPLLTTAEPTVRVGPVVHPMLLADSAFLLLTLPGPGEQGPPVVSSQDPDLVALAEAAFLEVWEQSVTWQEAGLRAPLPDRRFRIAVLLVDGCTDREIAEELGTSTRTVSHEVREIVDWLGARNRGHAVAMLVGAG